MEFLDLKVPGGSQSGAKHDQNFCIEIAFSRQNLTEQSIEECEKLSFGGNLIKISISVLNFSIELAKKKQ